MKQCPTQSLLTLAVVVGLGLASSATAAAQRTSNRPNILIIWGDDVGQFNISAYNLG